jgi:hypothetical protein
MDFLISWIERPDFWKVDEFCKEQGIGLMDPEFSKVCTAIDLKTGRVVGIIAAQMVIHSEPIWIDKEWQGTRIWKRLSDEMDSYLTTMNAAGVYNQPSTPTAERLAQKMGYVKCDNPLWVKYYMDLPELKEGR